MGAMASQITSFTIVYSTVYLGVDKKTRPKLRVTGLCAGNSPVTGEFSAQMVSNAENVFIRWRHHGYVDHSQYPVYWWPSGSHCMYRHASEWNYSDCPLLGKKLQVNYAMGMVRRDCGIVWKLTVSWILILRATKSSHWWLNRNLTVGSDLAHTWDIVKYNGLKLHSMGKGFENYNILQFYVNLLCLLKR